MISTVQLDGAKACDYADRLEASAMRGIADNQLHGLSRVCVIGAGQMGLGIATALLQADIPVIMVDTQAERIERAQKLIRRNWAGQVTRGKLTEAQVEARMELFVGASSLSEANECDLFIEAVWEDSDLKKAIFAELAQLAPPNSILATNTSTLDVDAIADASSRPQDVLGLHFFNPAHVMRLLEIVRGSRTADRAVATGLQLARRLGKVPVVVGNAYGFVGNRIFAARDAQNASMLLEGASPAEIDAAMIAFGFPMGPFTLQDMAGGIELTWRLRQADGSRDPIGDALYEAGRLGVQSGGGYYRYEPGDRTPQQDAEVDALIATERAKAGVSPRRFSADEITERMILPMVNEAAKILSEGIAGSPTDIDLVWNAGFGWPRHKGGITYFADHIGIVTVVERLLALKLLYGPHFTPAPFLQEMAKESRSFADLAS